MHINKSTLHFGSAPKICQRNSLQAQVADSSSKRGQLSNPFLTRSLVLGTRNCSRQLPNQGRIGLKA